MTREQASSRARELFGPRGAAESWRCEPYFSSDGACSGDHPTPCRARRDVFVVGVLVFWIFFRELGRGDSYEQAFLVAGVG